MQHPSGGLIGGQLFFCKFDLLANTPLTNQDKPQQSVVYSHSNAVGGATGFGIYQRFQEEKSRNSCAAIALLRLLL